LNIEALVFDVDGTMADTEEMHRVAFNEAFSRAGVRWSWSREQYRELLAVSGGKERIARHIGEVTAAGAKRDALLAQVPALHAEKTRIFAALVGGGAVPLREGVARLVAEARSARCRLAIATTTTAENVDALLNATLGPGARTWFDVIACGDEVAAKKPAPDIYRLALARLGVAPESAVAFEDSPNGLRAAVAAGLWTVVTPTYWTEGGDFAAAGLLLPRLGEPERPLEGAARAKLGRCGWLALGELAGLRAGSAAPATAATN
jgi:beta-phosphoglucomutase-like phosphatase (HAD superfamily)